MRLYFAGLLLFCAACKSELPPERASGENIYTLYRGGAVEKSVRIHYATFETSGEDISWNMNNCEKVAASLNVTQKKEILPVKFWCEKGRYKE